ncbi:type IV secretion system protein [Methylovorus mays]|uniref:type IV secretion system protein n=1 Tax=Methylovorus mays TaxID=184077 RepID=UPI001E39DE50|nr:type IV secretion system protein [Methylovorus mays]MCB5207796.1 type IV secretion system protein [Methylovorus mays]
MAAELFVDAAQTVLGSASAYLDMKLALMTNYGLSLFTGLAALSFAWYGVRVLLANGDVTDIFGSLIRQMLTVTFVYWLLKSGYQTVFIEGVAGSLDTIATQLLPVQQGSPAELVGEVFSRFFKSGMAIFSTLDSIIDPSLNPLSKLSLALSSLTAISALMMSSVILIVSGGLFFVLSLGSQYMVVIALILGPVCLPWLLMSQTSFVAESWIRFLITASLWKVLAAIIIGISDSMFQAVIQKAVDAAASGAANYGEILVAAVSASLGAALMAWLLLQVPSIASAIVGGSSGVSGFNFNSIRKLVGGKVGASSTPSQSK